MEGYKPIASSLHVILRVFLLIYWRLGGSFVVFVDLVDDIRHLFLSVRVKWILSTAQKDGQI